MELRATPVIALTSLSDEESRRRGLKAGFVRPSPYGPAVSAEARTKADAVKAEMLAGNFAIFKDGLKDNKGNIVVPAGTAYSQTVTATGGVAPYSFAVTAGTLPAGLVLGTASGIIMSLHYFAGVVAPLIAAQIITATGNIVLAMILTTALPLVLYGCLIGAVCEQRR